jgi:hypothetical protein
VVKRLNREKDVLADTVKYYSATVALKSLQLDTARPSSGDDKTGKD